MMMIVGKDMIKINEKNERIHEINEGIQNVLFCYDCNMGSKLVTSNSFARGQRRITDEWIPIPAESQKKFEPREF